MSLPQAPEVCCCSGVVLGARAEPAGARALFGQRRGGAGRQSCDLPPGMAESWCQGNQPAMRDRQMVVVFCFFFSFPSWFLAESKMSLLFGFLLPLPHRLSLKVVFQISSTHVV